MTNSHPRLRVLAIETHDGIISAVARADVVGGPFRRWRVEPTMSGLYDPSRPKSRPFLGERLSSAVWDPIPPEALVAILPDTALAIPDEITTDLPWIIVLRAWARLLPNAPSKLLDACWRHTIDNGEHRKDYGLEDDVSFTCGVLRVLLDRFPAEELVAFSR